MTAIRTFTNDMSWVAFLIWSICEDKKNPMEDIVPQIKKIFTIKRGKKVIEVEKKITLQPATHTLTHTYIH